MTICHPYQKRMILGTKLLLAFSAPWEEILNHQLLETCLFLSNKFSNKYNSTKVTILQIKYLLPALFMQQHLVLQPNNIFTFSKVYHCFQLTSAWSCLPKYMSDEIAFTLPNFFCASSVLEDGSYSGLRRDAGLEKKPECISSVTFISWQNAKSNKQHYHLHFFEVQKHNSDL